MKRFSAATLHKHRLRHIWSIKGGRGARKQKVAHQRLKGEGKIKRRKSKGVYRSAKGGG
jgi:hypothetical protein